MFARILRSWLPLAVVVTVLVALVYVVAQQNYRNGADDPQSQLAAQAAAWIALHGEDPTSIVGTRSVDIATSPAPFVIVYGADRRPVAGDGLLGGSLPTPPQGLFLAASANGQDRVTWQPRPGVRIAAVVVPIAGGRGWVLSGRSLAEAERRIDQLRAIAVSAWAIALLGAFVVIALLARQSISDR